MFSESITEAEKLAQPEDFDFLALVGDGFNQLRRYTPTLLEALPMKAAPAARELLAGVEVLKGMNERQARKVPDDAPTSFVRKRWESLVHTKAGVRGQFAGQVNLKYGQEPGVQFYTHISDQYAPFHTKVINATVRDATHVLDGLLYHESDLRIEEHYTDTAGFTDHVFGLMHLLGFRFAPRIRDLADKRLYIHGDAKLYPTLAGLIGGNVNVKHIRAHWDDILRLAASIKQGTVTASLMLRKLGSYPRQNGLAIALRELGRIERTLFALD